MNREIWFKFVLNQELPRTTTKQRYKAIMHWLRFARWNVIQKVNVKFVEKALVDLAVYGQSVSMFMIDDTEVGDI